MHRESFDGTFPGPAQVMSDVKRSSVEWYYCGKLHRDAFDVDRTNLPAKIIYNHQYNRTTESWYVHGILHKTDGPAEVTYHNGEIIDHLSIYSINGNRVNSREFLRNLTMQSSRNSQKYAYLNADAKK